MSRLFDGTDDQMVYGSVTGFDVNGAHTLLVVARIMRVADNTWESFMETETSAAGASASMIRQQLNATLGSLGYSSNVSLSNAGTALTDSDGWMVMATTKGAGSSTPRMHSSIIASATHRHNDGGGAFGASASISGGTIRLGGDDDHANMRLAAAAIFTKVLTDGEIEGIAVAKTTASINALGPAWLVDDSDAFATDLTAGTVNRTSISGTTDDADDPAGWVYGLGGTDYTGTVPGAAASTASGPIPGVTTVVRPYVSISVS